MASSRTPLPKTPLVVSAGAALIIASAACGDDTGTGGTGGSGGVEAPPGLSDGGNGGQPPGEPAGGTENVGGAGEAPGLGGSGG
jgi:hypothetical protein